jgi:hypothetical protein
VCKEETYVSQMQQTWCWGEKNIMNEDGGIDKDCRVCRAFKFRFRSLVFIQGQ